jgi:hypothetical protein
MLRHDFISFDFFNDKNTWVLTNTFNILHLMETNNTIEYANGPVTSVVAYPEIKEVNLSLGEWRYSPIILDLGTGWSVCQLHALAALPAGKELLVPFAYEAGWAPEPV